MLHCEFNVYIKLSKILVIILRFAYKLKHKLYHNTECSM